MSDSERNPSPPPRVLGKVIKRDSVGELPETRPPLPAPQPSAAGGKRSGGVVNAEEFEARSQAQHILAEAQKKAAEIVDEAKRQRDEAIAEAESQARKEVLARGVEEIARAKIQAGQILSSSEKDILALSLKIAAKIIGRDLERDPEVLLEICATAIENARASKSMVLRVNPKDSALLREKKPKMMELIGRTVEIAIRDDSEVEEGGCVIETEFGRIDAQLSTQYEMLQNVLYPNSAKKEGPK